jgi:hypothetical protein
VPFAWERLIGLVAERKIVPVIGQDLLQVATPLGEMPLYRFLAVHAAQRLEIDAPPAETPNPLHAMATQHLQQGGDWLSIYEAVCGAMEETATLALPPALVDLAAIEPLSLFVTTTFDPLLQRALNRGRYDGKDLTHIFAFTPGRTTDLPDTTYDSTTASVFHLFGRYGMSPEYAVTEEDTLEFMHLLQSDVKRPQNLFRELAQRDLLMIGNSFTDWVARFFLRLTKQERVWVAETRNRFVAELRRRWSERAKKAAEPSPFAVEPGTVFVSYASEDRKLAQAIADALRAEKIDVWFDQEQLKSGAAYDAKIADAIDRCAVFVPVISKTVADPRGYIFAEWRAAIDVAKKASWTSKFLMPVVVDDVAYDDENVPREFRARTWQRVGSEGPERSWIEEVRGEVRRYKKAGQAETA